jgi:tetratricopeptide (TPR) repeat protein
MSLPGDASAKSEIARMAWLMPLVMPLMPIVAGWKQINAKPSADAGGAPRVVDAVADLLGEEAAGELRAGVAAGDRRALAATEALRALLPPIIEGILRQCRALRNAKRWSELRAEAAAVLRLAQAADRRDLFAQGLFCTALALRGLQDTEGAISAYQAVLENVPKSDVKTQSAAHDNLGNLLTEVGKFDDALQHFETAASIEMDPMARFSILFNHSRALGTLGRYSDAAELQRQGRLMLEKAGAPPAIRAIAADNEAQLLERMGDLPKAIDLSKEAAALFPAHALQERATNALIRARLHHALGDDPAAAEAYGVAIGLAEQVARHSVDVGLYRRGFLAALRHLLPSSDEVTRRILAALIQDRKGEKAQSEANLIAAIERCLEQGDHLTALRTKAHLAAQKFDDGDVLTSGGLARDVQYEAASRGLALPEAMALGTLASLSDAGADSRLDTLFAYVRAARLLAVHRDVATAAKLDDKRLRWETYDSGTLDNQLAKLAERHGAYAIAAEHISAAAAYAEQNGDTWRLANRLAGLLALLKKLQRPGEIDAVVVRLRALFAGGPTDARVRLVARRALAAHLGETDPNQALEDIKEAVTAAEEIRGQIADLSLRADSDRQYHDVYPRYAMLLRRNGDTKGAFEALQLGKGRALLDAAQARGQGDGQGNHGRPPDLTTVQAALAPSDALVDLAVEADGIAAYVVTRTGLTVVRAADDAMELAEADRGDLRHRAARLVALCRTNKLLTELASAVNAAVPPGARLLLVPDPGLHNLPLHIVPVEARPWCERVPIGYVPAACALLSQPGGGVSVFVAGDSRRDLPGAKDECEAIARLYGVTALTGSACTRAALEAALDAGPLDIVHLAVHGRANPLMGGQACIILADGKGGTELVDLRSLATRPWRANLVVLSGCSTGLSGPREGYQLVSVASQIQQAGAAAVVACLWPVGDAAAHETMVAFHTALVAMGGGERDIRLALDVGRATLSGLAAPTVAAVRDGRDGRDVIPDNAPSSDLLDPAVEAALDWASFMAVGNPRIGVRITT